LIPYVVKEEQILEVPDRGQMGKCTFCPRADSGETFPWSQQRRRRGNQRDTGRGIQGVVHED